MPSEAIAPNGSLKGVQEPRIACWPSYTTTALNDVLAVARLAGIELDPWQVFQLRHGLGESPDWKCPECVWRHENYVRCPVHPGRDLIHPWSAFEVCSVVPRQNGKSLLLVVRMLGGLFVLEEQLQIFSAHQFDTALEIMRQLAFFIANTSELRAEVKHTGSRMSGIVWGNGKEGIELANGLRVRFKARTGGGGRGFSCDTLYLDEGMILPEIFLGATIPTLSAKPNPQIWLSGSAPDEWDPTHDGIVLAKRRNRALKGGDQSLAYFEHSARINDDPTKDDPDTIPPEALEDPKVWAGGNPSLGIRITPKYIGDERLAMGARQFAVERLGITTWPKPEEGYAVIASATWALIADNLLPIVEGVAYGVDVSEDRRFATMAAAGRREDGVRLVEVGERQTGLDWIVPRAAKLVEKYGDVTIALASNGAAASLKDDLENTGVTVLLVKPGEQAQACGQFYDGVTEKTFRHRGTSEMRAAVKGAVKKKHANAWVWDPASSTVDITPLVSATLALWASRGGSGEGLMGFSDEELEQALAAGELEAETETEAAKPEPEPAPVMDVDPVDLDYDALMSFSDDELDAALDALVD